MVCRSCAVLLAVWVVGCGSSSPTPIVVRTEVAAPTSAAVASPGPRAAGAHQDELGALLVDLVSPELCKSLRGQFVGLPGESSRQGAAAGLEPATGRWWLRRCQADGADGRLRLRIAGPGWMWLERESSGFRVRQYLRFEAEAELDASMHVGYDPQRRIASLWMQPGQQVEAKVTPVGLVNAEATDVFSSIVGRLLSITGSSASERARTQAQEEGSAQLAQRLAAGFTLTFNLRQSQLDFLVGSLPRGQTPERPYRNEPGVSWQLNERSMTWPGGFDVLGPFDANAQQTLDVSLEEGEGLSVHIACAEEFAHYLDRRWRGVAAKQPKLEAALAVLRHPHEQARVSVAPMPCRAVLVAAPPPDAALPVRARYRLATGVPDQERMPDAELHQPLHATIPEAFRVQIQSVQVRERNAEGQLWDVLGGEADLFVETTSIARQRILDRTATHEDDNAPSYAHWLPGSFRALDLPLRFSAFDADMTEDEPVGSADLTRAQLVRATAGELVLELRSQGRVARHVGSIRLRVEALR